MNRFKYEAFVDEFPFLDKIMAHHTYGPEDLTGRGIIIKRADERLLDSIPIDSGYDCCIGKRWTKETFHFTTNNETILSAVRCKVDWQYAENHTPLDFHEGESVLEAINRHGITEDLDTIVYVFSRGCSFDDTPTVRKLELYKVPKETTYKELVDRAHQNARNNLKAEIAVVLE